MLLSLHAGLAVSSMARKSATFDEVVRLTSGVSYWVTGDYRLDPAEPPLAQMWAALPVLAGEYTFPDLDQPAWWISDAESIGRQFFFALDNDTDAILFRARVMIVLLSVACGALVFLWSRRLFGLWGGLMSAGLYAMSPNMLAHARLVTTETATCLFFVAALGALWWVLCEVRPLSVLACGLAMAGLFLSKMSAPLIIPVGVVMVAARLVFTVPLRLRAGRWSTAVRNRFARVGVLIAPAVVVTLIAMGGLWAAHRFRFEGMVEAVDGRDRYCPPSPISPDESSWDFVLEDAGLVGDLVERFRWRRLLPESYLYGVAFQFKALDMGYGFLCGERRVTGWWWFFPYCLAVKTPLALFGLLALAGVGAIVRGRQAGLAVTDESSARQPRTDGPGAGGGPTEEPGEGGVRADSHANGADSHPSIAHAHAEPAGCRTDPMHDHDRMIRTLGLIAIGTFLAVYWVLAIRSTVNIGHRHILPTYPFLFILAGGAVAWWRSWRPMRWVVLALTVAFAAASLWIWPDYLAYFNRLAGGPSRGYRHLVDSSLDWGQDLPALRRHLKGVPTGPDARPPVPDPIYLSYFGTDSPDRFDIDAAMLTSHMPWKMPRLVTLRPGTYCISATMLQVMYVLPTNRWTETFESIYQLLRPEMTAALAGTGKQDLPPSEVSAFRLMRFGRLCARLRLREPDELVGYSILVYELDDDALRQALVGEPVEVVADDPSTGGPAVLEWMRRLAMMLAWRGRPDEAATWFERVLSFEPGHAGAVSGLVEVCLKQNDPQRAVAALRRAVEREPDNPLLLNNLAWLLATSKDEGLRDGLEAVRLAERAYRLARRETHDLLDTLSAAHAEAGHYELAEQHARHAAAIARGLGDTDAVGALMRRAELYASCQAYRE